MTSKAVASFMGRNCRSRYLQSQKYLNVSPSWLSCSYRTNMYVMYTTCHCSGGVNKLNPRKDNITSQQPFSTEVAENATTIYDSKIVSIVDDISKLTLIEVADLNTLLKERLQIPDAPVMTMAHQAPTSAKPEEAETKQGLFKVKLTKYDEGKKVALIKEIKLIIAGINLVQAKKFVESVPQDIKKECNKEEAEKLKASLEAAGGTVILE